MSAKTTLVLDNAEFGATLGCSHAAHPSVSSSAKWTAQGVGIGDRKVSEVSAERGPKDF